MIRVLLNTVTGLLLAVLGFGVVAGSVHEFGLYAVAGWLLLALAPLFYIIGDIVWSSNE